jgi:hypothetical protein
MDARAAFRIAVQPANGSPAYSLTCRHKKTRPAAIWFRDHKKRAGNRLAHRLMALAV